MKPTTDALVFFLREYNHTLPALPFNADSPEEARAWTRKARSRLQKLLGDFPKPLCPVKTRTIEERKFAGYTRTKLEMELYPGMTAIAYYLLPDNRLKKAPAVLASPGHSDSVLDILGGPDGRCSSGDYGLQCALAGLPTLALEQIAFGERRHALAIAEKPDGGTSCIIPTGAALMLGRTLLGYRVVEARRAIDWLCARPEVDSKRIGMTGISGGGSTTFFTTCLEPRIKVAVICGYFNTFRDSVYSIYHCSDNFVPGILQWFEMPDLTGLIAPRPLFVLQGESDPIFPLKGFKEALKKAKSIYSVYGVPNNLGSHTYPGEHEWNEEKAIPWLASRL